MISEHPAGHPTGSPKLDCLTSATKDLLAWFESAREEDGRCAGLGGHFGIDAVNLEEGQAIIYFKSVKKIGGVEVLGEIYC